MSPGMRVFIRVVVVLVVIALIAGVLGAALYAWVVSLADTDEEVEKMHFSVFEAPPPWKPMNPIQGSFFIIRAGKGVNIDLYEYSFHVGEKGQPPIKLDTYFREYMDTPPYGPDPNSGDLNKSYDWKQDGELWSEGEYICFDVPKESSGIVFEVSTLYEVTIKNSRGDIVFRDTFISWMPC